MNKNILLTITGPSLTGKSELAKLLKPCGFEELVSTTTRPARTGEIDGINYNFVSHQTFSKMVVDKLMIQKNPVGDNMYGLSRQALEKVISKGNNGIVVVAPDGALQVREYCDKNNILCHQIFINNDMDVLVRRFLKRYKEDKLANDDTYVRRIIDMTTVEVTDWVEPAYDGTHHYDQIIENFGPQTQQETVSQIQKAVFNKLNKSKKLRN